MPGGGGVSKITVSNCGADESITMKSVKRSKAATSAVQGPLICSSITFTIGAGKAARRGARARSIYSCVDLSGSISMAHRFGTPLMAVIWWPIGCSKTSARLEAGSVVTISVRWPWSAYQTAWVHAMLVLPTPPLPEKKMNWVMLLLFSLFGNGYIRKDADRLMASGR